jgi:dinuclear metal center YbgI/SA1388 family protein
MTTVRDVMAVLNRLAPPHLALGDDPRGLLIGDRDAPVTHLAVALDITPAVTAAAITDGAQMMVAHHPLIFHPLKTLHSDTPHPEGVVLDCVRANIAVACAHTNWDVATGGINDVLATALGLSDIRPLQITYREALVKIAVFVPVEASERVLDAMAQAGAGAIGDYDRCAFTTPGTGTFRPLPGATPYIGSVGTPETVTEVRLEMVAPEGKWRSIVAAMKAAHPYEEVAYDVFSVLNKATEYGIGRIGTLPSPIPAQDFWLQVKDALDFPEVRFSGPTDKSIQTVAVCGGAGASLMRDALSAGADALVTSDVRHHEYVDAESRGFVLLDAGHSATETPGTRELARLLAEALPDITVRFHLANGTEG